MEIKGFMYEVQKLTRSTWAFLQVHLPTSSVTEWDCYLKSANQETAGRLAAYAASPSLHAFPEHCAKQVGSLSCVTKTRMQACAHVQVLEHA